MNQKRVIRMSEKVLICYGSRYGSAGEIAEKIGEIIQNSGPSVDVINLKKEKVKDLADYDWVIIGSGIQMGKWTKEPLKFLKKNREVLSRKKVALFVSCLSAAEPDKCNMARRDYLDKVNLDFPEIEPVTMGLFGGLIDPSKGNIMTKKIMQTLMLQYTKDGEEPPERIDLRDWEQIRIWAESIVKYPFDD
jgi:menaquinone-dependent protoporphyrinogen oxidase